MSYTVELNTLEALLQRMPHDGIVGSKTHQTWGGFVQAGEQLKKLNNFIQSPDDMLSDKANALRIEEQRTKFQAALKTASDRALTTVAELRASQLARQITAASLVENEQAAEIRAVFRGLNSSEKADFMAQALKTDDKPVIAALTNPATSPLLTGLSGADMGLYRTHYLDKFLPTDSDHIDNIEVATKAALNALAHI